MSKYKTNNSTSEISTLLENNQIWAADKIANDANYFTRLSAQHKPKYLWIGCADSRVPANEILGLAPGEIFVHRNVANLVIHTDFNALSVIEYAVDVLKVEHIILCGHYGCGGIEAASNSDIHHRRLIDNWLSHIRDIHTKYKNELDLITNEQTKLQRLCELNVFEQVQNICRTTIIKAAWRNGQKVTLHGCIYSIKNGLLHELFPAITGHA